MENMSQGYDQPRPAGEKGRHESVEVAKCERRVQKEKDRLTKDDLRSSIVSRRDDRRVVLLLERRRSEVDKPDVGVVEDETLRSARDLSMNKGKSAREERR